jgi:hypothetical protein
MRRPATQPGWAAAIQAHEIRIRIGLDRVVATQSRKMR